MKKHILFLLLLPLLAACGQKSGYEITGIVPGAPDGAVVRLIAYDQYPAVQIDSTVVSGGKFTIENSHDLRFTRYAGLSIDMTPEVEDSREKTLKGFMFMLSNDRITFECPAAELPDYYRMPGEKQKHVELKGGKEQQLYDEYKKATDELLAKRGSLRMSYLGKYGPGLDSDMQEGIGLVRERNRIFETMNAIDYDFITANGNTMTAVYIADRTLSGLNIGTYTEDRISSIMQALDKDLLQSPLGIQLVDTSIEALARARGTVYKDVELVDADDRKVKLSELIKPGQYAMVEFWASWCSPCRGEIPHLRHVYEHYGDRLNIISISIDDDDAAWKKALSEEGMQWPQLRDPAGRKGEAWDKYRINGIPCCILLDPQGRIAAGSLRGVELDEFLDRAMEK